MGKTRGNQRQSGSISGFRLAGVRNYNYDMRIIKRPRWQTFSEINLFISREVVWKLGSESGNLYFIYERSVQINVAWICKFVRNFSTNFLKNIGFAYRFLYLVSPKTVHRTLRLRHKGRWNSPCLSLVSIAKHFGYSIYPECNKYSTHGSTRIR